MRILPCAPALVALLLAAAPAHAQQRGGTDTACARDVLVANSMQRQAIDQLEQAGSEAADQCRVWRRRMVSTCRVASVYGRCLSGVERTDRLNQVQTSEKEFAGMIRSQCKGL